MSVLSAKPKRALCLTAVGNNTRQSMTDQVQWEIGMNDFSIFRLDMVSLSCISMTCETRVSTPPFPNLPGYV